MLGCSVFGVKGYTRNTGQRSQCTVTAQAVARARIDHRSVERSITCTAYVWMQTTGTNHNTCFRVVVCECASITLSSQANRHYDIAERLLKTSKGTGYASYKYSTGLWTLSSWSSSASTTCRSRCEISGLGSQETSGSFEEFCLGIWDKIELPWTFFFW